MQQQQQQQQALPALDEVIVEMVRDMAARRGLRRELVCLLPPDQELDVVGRDALLALQWGDRPRWWHRAGLHLAFRTFKMTDCGFAEYGPRQMPHRMVVGIANGLLRALRDPGQRLSARNFQSAEVSQAEFERRYYQAEARLRLGLAPPPVAGAALLPAGQGAHQVDAVRGLVPGQDGFPDEVAAALEDANDSPFAIRDDDPEQRGEPQRRTPEGHPVKTRLINNGKMVTFESTYTKHDQPGVASICVDQLPPFSVGGPSQSLLHVGVPVRPKLHPDAPTREARVSYEPVLPDDLPRPRQLPLYQKAAVDDAALIEWKLIGVASAVNADLIVDGARLHSAAVNAADDQPRLSFVFSRPWGGGANAWLDIVTVFCDEEPLLCCAPADSDLHPERVAALDMPPLRTSFAAGPDWAPSVAALLKRIFVYGRAAMGHDALLAHLESFVADPSLAIDRHLQDWLLDSLLIDEASEMNAGLTMDGAIVHGGAEPIWVFSLSRSLGPTMPYDVLAVTCDDAPLFSIAPAGVRPAQPGPPPLRTTEPPSMHWALRVLRWLKRYITEAGEEFSQDQLLASLNDMAEDSSFTIDQHLKRWCSWRGPVEDARAANADLIVDGVRLHSAAVNYAVDDEPSFSFSFSRPWGFPNASPDVVTVFCDDEPLLCCAPADSDLHPERVAALDMPPLRTSFAAGPDWAPKFLRLMRSFIVRGTAILGHDALLAHLESFANDPSLAIDQHLQDWLLHEEASRVLGDRGASVSFQGVNAHVAPVDADDDFPAYAFEFRRVAANANADDADVNADAGPPNLVTIHCDDAPSLVLVEPGVRRPEELDPGIPFYETSFPGGPTWQLEVAERLPNLLAAAAAAGGAPPNVVGVLIDECTAPDPDQRAQLDRVGICPPEPEYDWLPPAPVLKEEVPVIAKDPYVPQKDPRRYLYQPGPNGPCRGIGWNQDADMQGGSDYGTHRRKIISAVPPEVLAQEAVAKALGITYCNLQYFDGPEQERVRLHRPAPPRDTPVGRVSAAANPSWVAVRDWWYRPSEHWKPCVVLQNDEKKQQFQIQRLDDNRVLWVPYATNRLRFAPMEPSYGHRSARDHYFDVCVNRIYGDDGPKVPPAARLVPSKRAVWATMGEWICVYKSHASWDTSKTAAGLTGQILRVDEVRERTVGHDDAVVRYPVLGDLDIDFQVQLPNIRRLRGFPVGNDPPGGATKWAALSAVSRCAGKSLIAEVLQGFLAPINKQTHLFRTVGSELVEANPEENVPTDEKLTDMWNDGQGAGVDFERARLRIPADELERNFKDYKAQCQAIRGRPRASPPNPRKRNTIVHRNARAGQISMLPIEPGCRKLSINLGEEVQLYAIGIERGEARDRVTFEMYSRIHSNRPRPRKGVSSLKTDATWVLTLQKQDDRVCYVSMPLSLDTIRICRGKPSCPPAFGNAVTHPGVAPGQGMDLPEIRARNRQLADECRRRGKGDLVNKFPTHFPEPISTPHPALRQLPRNGIVVKLADSITRDQLARAEQAVRQHYTAAGHTVLDVRTLPGDYEEEQVWLVVTFANALQRDAASRGVIYRPHILHNTQMQVMEAHSGYGRLARLSVTEEAHQDAQPGVKLVAAAASAFGAAKATDLGREGVGADKLFLLTFRERAAADTFSGSSGCSTERIAMKSDVAGTPGLWVDASRRAFRMVARSTAQRNLFSAAKGISRASWRSEHGPWDGPSGRWLYDIPADGDRPAVTWHVEPHDEAVIGDGDFAHYLVVRNVPPQATRAEVHAHFEQFGRVTAVHLVGRRMALVQFEEHSGRARCFIHGILGDEPGVREHYPVRGTGGYVASPLVLDGREEIKAYDSRGCMFAIARLGQQCFSDPGGTRKNLTFIPHLHIFKETGGPESSVSKQLGKLEERIDTYSSIAACPLRALWHEKGLFTQWRPKESTKTGIVSGLVTALQGNDIIRRESPRHAFLQYVVAVHVGRALALACHELVRTGNLSTVVLKRGTNKWNADRVLTSLYFRLLDRLGGRDGRANADADAIGGGQSVVDLTPAARGRVHDALLNCIYAAAPPCEWEKGFYSRPLPFGSISREDLTRYLEPALRDAYTSAAAHQNDQRVLNRVQAHINRIKLGRLQRQLLGGRWESVVYTRPYQRVRQAVGLPPLPGAPAPAAGAGAGAADHPAPAAGPADGPAPAPAPPPADGAPEPGPGPAAPAPAPPPQRGQGAPDVSSTRLSPPPPNAWGSTANAIPTVYPKSYRRHRKWRELKHWKRRRRIVIADDWIFISNLLALCEIISLVWFDSGRVSRKYFKGKPRVFTSTAARRLMSWQHGGLRQRIIWKARVCDLVVPVYSEAYTTQCCGLCYRRNKVGGSRHYTCECGYSGDRDAHAAWNQLRAQIAWGVLVAMDRDGAYEAAHWQRVVDDFLH